MLLPAMPIASLYCNDAILLVDNLTQTELQYCASCFSSNLLFLLFHIRRIYSAFHIVKAIMRYDYLASCQNDLHDYHVILFPRILRFFT